MKRPTNLLQPLHHIKNFLSSSMLVQRNNYRQWIQEVSSPKKIAILKPNLDWKRIWMETAAVPTHIREIMFLFNQWLLPTKNRCHRIDFNINQNCLFRNQDSKTDEHLTLLGTLFGRRDPETRSQENKKYRTFGLPSVLLSQTSKIRIIVFILFIAFYFDSFPPYVIVYFLFPLFVFLTSSAPIPKIVLLLSFVLFVYQYHFPNIVCSRCY